MIRSLKKNLIFIIALTSSATFSQEAKLSQTELIKSQAQESYIGANLGGSLGNTGYGITLGKRLNDKNILELNYKTWTEREVNGLQFNGAARVIYNGFGIGASNKYFFYNSFNLKVGAFYRSSTIDIPQGLNLLVAGRAVSQRDISDISAEVSIGNQWLGERWGFAIDWLGFTPTILELDNIEGFERSNLQVLNFTLSYSF